MSTMIIGIFFNLKLIKMEFLHSLLMMIVKHVI